MHIMHCSFLQKLLQFRFREGLVVKQVQLKIITEKKSNPSHAVHLRPPFSIFPRQFLALEFLCRLALKKPT